MEAGVPALFVSVKLAAATTPVTVAATVYVPKSPFAENAADVAKPSALVVAVFVPPANVPLAPVCAGAVKVTVAPFTGLWPTSVTIATSGAANAVLMLALCPDPLYTAIDDGDPGWLVNEKLAAVATPATEALTV